MATPPPTRSFWRVIFATGVMAVTVGWLGHAFVPAIVLAGVATYVGALALVGGIRFHRGALPEIVA